jgi:hypothetical protein
MKRAPNECKPLAAGFMTDIERGFYIVWLAFI